jgi:hypothetical protein
LISTANALCCGTRSVKNPNVHKRFLAGRYDEAAAWGKQSVTRAAELSSC